MTEPLFSDNDLFPIRSINLKEEDIPLGLVIDPNASDRYYDRLLKYLIGYYVHLNANYNISIKDSNTKVVVNYTTNFDESFLNLEYILHDGSSFLIAEEGEFPQFNLKYYREQYVRK